MSKDLERRSDVSIENLIKELHEQVSKATELTEKLVSNAEYMLWLEKFTTSNPEFTDDAWLYFPEEISKYDYEMVSMLQYFLDGIKRYAHTNYIPMEGDVYDYHFSLKFNNIDYKIGAVSGQGTYTYCCRENISTDKRFIDFNDIMTNKVQDNVAIITEKLNAMANIAKEILNLGAPEDAITSKLETVFQEYFEGGEV